ncbi:CAF17-like 4Fe-4S cluster assembly/insertion protein YgfZ [Gilvimarinus sp. 1_MG-2023]|uniref:CAF17-like 4Fe-4S cluster assembly/insertion protein YgfZ n=1 Tax=Gilvimarinus sp. 1_MG-2023 TaxID=3062638 RepID=UPI0026E1EFC6|nr:hypothetical protein [Gilvimarinus sp. 1_MG-2023]MDO6747111.1 hypothetical protein [Gilvimarinus sp. 1_MG-2023]
MSHWQDFLQQQGARFAADGGASFPAIDAQAPYLCDLGNTALVHIQGAEAAKFLQGQVTCDLRELSPTQWLPGAQCNLKGRVIASFAVAQTEPEALLLRTSHDLADTFITGLTKYAVFSKVTLSPAEDWQALGVCGAGAEQALADTLGLAFAESERLVVTQELIALKHDTDQIELWLKQEASQAQWLTLRETFTPAATGQWQLGLINAGRADVTTATSELFTPQDLNYPEIGAVSFKKGCYTGQEVVARLHYKGKLKKHLYPIEFCAAALPEAGSDLTDSDGKKRGQLVQWAARQDRLYRGLAVLPDEDGDELYIGDPPEQAKRLDLPYAIKNSHN